MSSPTPISPPSGPAWAGVAERRLPHWLFQGPPAESKLLAAIKKYLQISALFLIQFSMNYPFTVHAQAMGKNVTTKAPSVPVTSYRLDLHDDPETAYSEAPKFDSKFFGDRTRLLARHAPDICMLRDLMGNNVTVDWLFLEDFSVPLKNYWLKGSITGTPHGGNATPRPPIPVAVSSSIGKANYAPGEGEQPHYYKLEDIKEFIKAYPNLIYAGGQIAEIDDMLWCQNRFFERQPVSPGKRNVLAIFQDFLEAECKRGDVPYLSFQHNTFWALPYTAHTQIASFIDAQIMARDGHVIVPQYAQARSTIRQRPNPLGIQFSGQATLTASNVNEVIQKKAEPLWLPPNDDNYCKSDALTRQLLYYSWLNGANYFRPEGGFNGGSGFDVVPTPLALFTARADKVIERVGYTGPVQTPIALVSEFSHVWDKPMVYPHGQVAFFNPIQVPYEIPDYQRHGLMDFFYPFYLQTGTLYQASKLEDNSMTPTPYGSSVDFMLSDVRPEALKRYGLLIWAGVPPAAPTMVRDKILNYIRDNHGRVVVFGSAARAMFPESFDGSQLMGAEAKIKYNGFIFSEKYSFTLQELKSTAGMKVLATVDDKPLIVESHGGLVMVLSDYGLNETPHLDPANVPWVPNMDITEIPYQLLDHARLIVDEEAKKQVIFDVGNKALTHIITRPRSGEYLLGLFNDKKTSEPFKITSHIGTVTSMEEIKLDDGKDLLKSVVNGAAYVDAGLRKSPNLPLNYGLSDASNIEGRDFRLFRIKIGEVGVRDVAQFKFPQRPERIVVSVSGLSGIRRYIQGIPSFLQWFDGIKITAASLLSTDNMCISDEKFWLDRLALRVVVDGRNLSEPGAVRAINKLGLLERSPKNLIFDSPSAAIKTLADQKKVVLVSSNQVKWLAKLKDRFKSDSMLNIVDLFYRDEESLYLDWNYFKNNASSDRLKGYTDACSLIGQLTEKVSAPKDYIYAGIDIHDLKSLIKFDAVQFKKYRGIKIDSTYLLSKTPEALAQDALVLKAHNLDVIVDLRRDQFHMDRITFYPHLLNYKKGNAMYQNIASKMPILGAKNLVVGVTDMYDTKTHPALLDQRDKAWVIFAKIAATHGFNLHLISQTQNATLSQKAQLDLPNVFVIKGLQGGKSSPYRLIEAENKESGTGEIAIHDSDRGIYFEAKR